MEKEEKKKVVINGQEIEVPEGYEVVVEGERIRVVPKEEKKETVKVVHAGEEVPEATVRTLKSVSLSFDEEKMKRNVATINKVEYVAGAVLAVFLGVLFTVAGVFYLGAGILAGNSAEDKLLLYVALVFGLFLSLGGLFSIWKGILLLNPILKGKTSPKKTPSKKVIS